jgi:hypothetical protein
MQPIVNTNKKISKSRKMALSDPILTPKLKIRGTRYLINSSNPNKHGQAGYLGC